MKKVLMSLLITLSFLFGITNVGAISAADMDQDHIDFSNILDYSLSDKKHVIEIKNLDHPTAYYQWIDVTSKSALLEKLEKYNSAVKKLTALQEQFKNSSSDEKEALDKEIEKARVASLEAQNAYYQQLTSDGMYVADDFKKTDDLDVTNPDMKEGHNYILWVKVVVNPAATDTNEANEANALAENDSQSVEYYAHAYIYAQAKSEEKSSATTTDEKKEVKNPDTGVQDYRYFALVFLGVGFGALVLKNRYSH